MEYSFSHGVVAGAIGGLLTLQFGLLTVLGAAIVVCFIILIAASFQK